MSIRQRGRPGFPGDLFARAQTIAGLRALADFLEDNPSVPVRELGEDYTVFARREDDAAERTEIDNIGAALGETVTDDTTDGGDYTVSKTFGRISTPLRPASVVRSDVTSNEHRVRFAAYH